MSSPSHTKRLRVLVLVAIAVVGLATLASFLGRRSRTETAASVPKPIAEDVDQQTQAFTLSKTAGDHTLYTIEAEEVTNFRDTGLARLRNVSIVIFGKDGTRRDRITTPECEYDPIARKLWIPGEVVMRLDLPMQEPGSLPLGSESLPNSVTITTSQLRFDQESGIAATEADVHIEYANGAGLARGAVYDPQSQMLHLKSDTRFEFGSPGGTALESEKTLLRAGSIRYFKQEGKISLEDSVEVRKGSRTVRAEGGTILLDGENRARRIELAGDVRASDSTAESTIEVRSGMGRIDLEEAGKIAHLHLEQDVKWFSAGMDSARSREGPVRDREGKSRVMDFSFDHPGDRLSRVVSTGEVELAFRNPRNPPTDPGYQSTGSMPIAGSERQIFTGQRAEMRFQPDGRSPESGTLTGDAELRILPRESTQPRQTIQAARFEMGLSEAGELDDFEASRSVQVVSELGEGSGERRVSTSEFLRAEFAPATGRLRKLRQSGDVRYQDGALRASAEVAVYDPSSGSITLEGKPEIRNAQGRNAGGRITAARITHDPQSGNLMAEGDVATTSASGKPGEDSPEPVHAVAERFEYQADTGKAVYTGNARLWQGTRFLLESDSLEWHRPQEMLVAQGRVYSLFTGQVEEAMPQASAGGAAPSVGEAAGGSGIVGGSETGAGAVEIRAQAMTFDRLGGMARYTGEVQMKFPSGTLAAPELEIHLEPQSPDGSGLESPAGYEIERVSATGGVEIVDGERRATGDRAEYEPVAGAVRLYGNPARVIDTSRGMTQGVQFTYQIGDDRISVAGESGSPAETRWTVSP